MPNYPNTIYGAIPTPLPRINTPLPSLEIQKTGALKDYLKSSANNIGKLPGLFDFASVKKPTIDSNALRGLMQGTLNDLSDKTALSPDGISLLGKAGGFMGTHGKALSAATSAFDMQSANPLYTGLEGAKDTVFDAMGPWGQALKIGDNIIGAVGGKTDISQGLGSADAANAVTASLLPGAGFFAKKTAKYNVSQDFMGSSSHTGSLKNANTVEDNAGKKLLFGRDRYNSMRDKAITADTLVSGAIKQNRELKLANAASQNQSANAFLNNGGYRHGAITTAKLGTKFERSIIAGGKLHARRHNLNEIDDKLSGNITNKGTAVVMFEEGGKVTQVSEYEVGELVLRVDITDIIEDLKDDGTDESAIIAGKLLADELLNNTKDYSEEYEIED